MREWKGLPRMRHDIKGEHEDGGAGPRLAHGRQHHSIHAAQPDPPEEATLKIKVEDKALLIPEAGTPLSLLSRLRGARASPEAQLKGRPLGTLPLSL